MLISYLSIPLQNILYRINTSCAKGPYSESPIRRPDYEQQSLVFMIKSAVFLRIFICKGLLKAAFDLVFRHNQLYSSVQMCAVGFGISYWHLTNFSLNCSVTPIKITSSFENFLKQNIF